MVAPHTTAAPARPASQHAQCRVWCACSAAHPASGSAGGGRRGWSGAGASCACMPRRCMQEGAQLACKRGAQCMERAAATFPWLACSKGATQFQSLRSKIRRGKPLLACSRGSTNVDRPTCVTGPARRAATSRMMSAGRWRWRRQAWFWDAQRGSRRASKGCQRGGVAAGGGCLLLHAQQQRLLHSQPTVPGGVPRLQRNACRRTGELTADHAQWQIPCLDLVLPHHPACRGSRCECGRPRQHGAGARAGWWGAPGAVRPWRRAPLVTRRSPARRAQLPQLGRSPPSHLRKPGAVPLQP